MGCFFGCWAGGLSLVWGFLFVCFFEQDWTFSTFMRASDWDGERTFTTWSSASLGELWRAGGKQKGVPVGALAEG